MSRDLLRNRLLFVLLAALGMAILLGWSDWAIRILYGAEFQEGGWMLFLLLFGTWASFLSGLNEAAVMGKGKPQFISLINVLRIAAMAVTLPAGFMLWGLPGTIMAMAAVELVRYLLISFAQLRLGAGFLGQDAIGTGVLTAILACFLILRSLLGLGEPWQGMF